MNRHESTPAIEAVSPWPLLPLREGRVADVLGGIGRFTLCANEPPYTRIAASLPKPARTIIAGDMALPHLQSLLEAEPESDWVVGVGGGSAIDTAKFIAWRTGKSLLQVPSITSVDAAFTDAIGVRIDGRVRYVGQLLPQFVLLDIELVQSAPPHMNRAGMGDVLSCHTGLWDWRFAVDAGEGVPWDVDAATLGRTLLGELADSAADIHAVSAEGVRWLMSAYRRIGAACAALRHSRFEEGSEHFLAYAFEALAQLRQSAMPLHGELIALCVLVMSSLQENDVDGVAALLKRTGVRAHPQVLGIDERMFTQALLGLADYVQREGLDYSIAHTAHVDAQVARDLWRRAQQLAL